MPQLEEFHTGSGLESEHRSLEKSRSVMLMSYGRNWQPSFLHWHCIVELSSKHRVNNYVPAEWKSVTITASSVLWIIGL
jgi:hypothetical protein